jgi:hypothetical protein
MAAKLPYHFVSERADALISQMAMAKDYHEAAAYYHKYVEWLKRCGYTPEQYQHEELKHIDSGWGPPKTSN